MTSYVWFEEHCYENPVWLRSCFYGGQKDQKVTGNNLLAGDHGEVKCIATISGPPIASDSIILHITGRMAKHCIQYCNY